MSLAQQKFEGHIKKERFTMIISQNKKYRIGLLSEFHRLTRGLVPHDMAKIEFDEKHDFFIATKDSLKTYSFDEFDKIPSPLKGYFEELSDHYSKVREDYLQKVDNTIPHAFTFQWLNEVIPSNSIPICITTENFDFRFGRVDSNTLYGIYVRLDHKEMLEAIENGKHFDPKNDTFVLFCRPRQDAIYSAKKKYPVSIWTTKATNVELTDCIDRIPTEVLFAFADCIDDKIRNDLW